MQPALPALEVGASRDDADVSVVLMHGLGADGHDFADVAQAMSRAALPQKWRFVLPHAPQQAVTINMGMRMPAWYDIIDLSQPRAVNWDTVEQSRERIETLIDAEHAPKLILAGFSQGAAMALHVGLRCASPVAGILLMSGYLLVSDARPCPRKTKDIPIGIFHGTADPVVPFSAAERTIESLTAAGHSPTLHPYEGLEHSLCDGEIRDVFAWLRSVVH
ncbi:MAG: alpha/beta fold hydrolase [Verrucomicrobia bacterium]|nr:alpha/beta fold hydrolase [Verrucomicrobiota bacterium]